MTLQNRVDPWGALQAVSARGALMGNRGVIHNDHKQIIAQWRHPHWVTCKLNFKNVQREVFSPNQYSELFFLDEATALSAGHRPCGECRRERFNEFKMSWCKANLDGALHKVVPIGQIDKQLHMERAARGGKKVTHQCAFETLPDGTFLEIGGKAILLWQKCFYQWSPYGYERSSILLASSEVVTVLTPVSIVKMFQMGFTPQVHESVYG